LIGAGGMGEVYRAIDTRLSRTVALKVLPSHLASDADRRQRLEREARIVSSLDHSNICALYDIGHENSRDFLVMQFLEGETLADRLKKGPLPIDRALTYGAEIANGLAAAHRLGVVHRDLKPGNVMLTKSGVKVLDFGLARLDATGAVPGVSNAQAHDGVSVPTQTDKYAMTEQGTVLGTLPYMAPEQIEGRPADARTDIFALGAVMFEMVTGQRAFEAPSTARTIAAILDQDPPAASSVRPDAPGPLDRVIRKCLEKDPDARWQSARDLADELKWIQQTATASSTASGGIRRSPIRTAIYVAVAALALAAVALVADRLRGREPAPPQFTRLTFQRGTISNARFSPDGRTIVYSASWEGRPSEVFMTAAGSPESRTLGVRDAELVGVSSSGELALLRSDGVLAVSPLTGARSPRDIAADVASADWAPSGELAAIRAWDPRQGFTPFEFPLGKSIGGTDLKTVAQKIRVARDGKSLAFTEAPLVAETSRLRLIDLSGTVRDLGTWSSITGFRFSSNGREIWLSGERAGSGPVLWAVTLTGDARVLARFPAEPVLLDVAPDGRALITTVEQRMHMTAVVDGQERDLSWLGASRTGDHE
jgi:eukaryotic-like serine/threonine-protein kinase